MRLFYYANPSYMWDCHWFRESCLITVVTKNSSLTLLTPPRAAIGSGV